MSRVGSHSVISVPLAIGVSLALAGSVLAASWSSPIALTASGLVRSGAIATLSATSAVAVYKNGAKIQTRRTIDSGATWRAAALVSKKGSLPDIAGSGLAVDVVWTQHGVVHYRRSTNGGATYRAVIELGALRVCPSGTAGCVPAPGAQVAHGPGNVVVVTWLDDRSDANIVYARVSTNAGATFGPARVVNRDESGRMTFSGPDVAVGKNGVINLAYLSPWATDMHTMQLRRSTDGGKTWGAANNISKAIDTNVWDGGYCQPSFSSAGANAYLAYCDGWYDEAAEETVYWIAFTRTLNNGKTWSVSALLTPPTANDTPSVHLRGGVVRLAYGHYENGAYQVLYQQTNHGLYLNWSPAEQVVADGYLGGVASLGGNAVVLFLDGNAKVTTRNP